MSVAFLAASDVRRAVSPHEAYDAVRAAFVAHARGEWTMQPKVYVASYPSGDFRAMPALGDGVAILKWVTSFPGNPALGLPTVTGLVLVSDAATGRLLALLDAAAVTALRTAAAGVLAAETLARPGAEVIAVVGCGVNGAETARLLAAMGRPTVVHDRDPTRATAVAGALGLTTVGLDEALRADAVITVTPGAEVLFPAGALSDGQHVSLMGADGPGKAEIAVEELARAHVFCDDWEQASHGGELAAAVGAGLVDRSVVTELGQVLAGSAEGRRSGRDVTLFDSTGLAVQDLAIARIVLAKLDALDVPRLDLES